MHIESCSPFSFIFNQIVAAEQQAQKELNATITPPPKRPAGRPPKQEEPPLAPNAKRHRLGDCEPKDNELCSKIKALIKLEYARMLINGSTVTAAIGLLAMTYEISYKDVFNICVA